MGYAACFQMLAVLVVIFLSQCVVMRWIIATSAKLTVMANVAVQKARAAVRCIPI